MVKICARQIRGYFSTLLVYIIGFGWHIHIDAQQRQRTGTGGQGVPLQSRVAICAALLEFLSGKLVQRNYAEVVHEYPVRSDVAWSDVVSAWGPFKADSINLGILGENNAEAVRIADRAGWR